MRRPLPSLSTRTEEVAPREPEEALAEAPRPEIPKASRPADRIKDALLRWLEEEM